MAVDPGEWHEEIESIERWYAQFGDSLPPEQPAELRGLKDRFARRGPRISAR
ncbi:GTP-dependent phosphoenolpyruvate carboxykinase [Arthrobacter sp. UYEF20]